MTAYLLAALLLTTPALGAELNQRWSDIMEDLHAMETGLAINQPRPVRTSRILADPPKTAERVKVAPVVVAQRPRDVCSRHGLRKVTIGKRWRCRK